MKTNNQTAKPNENKWQQAEQFYVLFTQKYKAYLPIILIRILVLIILLLLIQNTLIIAFWSLIGKILFFIGTNQAAKCMLLDRSQCSIGIDWNKSDRAIEREKKGRANEEKAVL